MATYVTHSADRAEAERLHRVLAIALEPTGETPPSVEELVVRIAAKRAGTANAFCSTGKGGGIDPTCAPGSSGSSGSSASSPVDAVTTKLKTAWNDITKYDFPDLEAIGGELSKLGKSDVYKVARAALGDSLGGALITSERSKKKLVERIVLELKESLAQYKRLDFGLGTNEWQPL